jgi:hypothetical protein
VSEWRCLTDSPFAAITPQWMNPRKDTGMVDTIVVTPVFDDFGIGANIVGHTTAIVPWVSFFQGELATGTDPVLVDMESSCGHHFTLLIGGNDVVFLDHGTDNHHDHDQSCSACEGMTVSAGFAQFSHDSCQYKIYVHPTQEYADAYQSNAPALYAAIVVSVFLVVGLAFLAFDCLVQRRQASLEKTARKQNALVSSLFPRNVQRQLLEDSRFESEEYKGKRNFSGVAGLRHFLKDSREVESGSVDSNVSGHFSTKPIADLFPETTIMFADIVGFTAWSSTREPSQVFTLLESIYSEYDALAKRRRVFKVEVVGDCYVSLADIEACSHCVLCF